MELGVADKDEGGTNPVGSATTRECPPKDDSDDDELELLSFGALFTPSWSLGPSVSDISRTELLCPAVSPLTLAPSLPLALAVSPCRCC